MSIASLPSRRNRCRLRRTLTVVGLASVFAAFAVFAAGRAGAQETRIPDVVLVRVLDHVPPAATERAEPEPEVALVARRMQRAFEDRLVAGVRRPNVELQLLREVLPGS